MDQITEFLNQIPELSLFLLFAGGIMIGLDLKKLSKVAMQGVKPDTLSFKLIFPGISLLVLGFILQSQ